MSADLNGYFGDTGATFTVPPVDPRIEYFCQITRKALNAAMAAARAGGKINQIGQAIEKTASNAGFKTIRDLGSHGLAGACMRNRISSRISMTSQIPAPCAKAE